MTRSYSDMLGRLDGVRRKEALAALTDEERQALVSTPPTPEDYGTWLRRQSARVQEQVLGPRRRQLWLDGTLNLHDLVDQRGRPLTLKQLQEVT